MLDDLLAEFPHSADLQRDRDLAHAELNRRQQPTTAGACGGTSQPGRSQAFEPPPGVAQGLIRRWGDKSMIGFGLGGVVVALIAIGTCELGTSAKTTPEPSDSPKVPEQQSAEPSGTHEPDRSVSFLTIDPSFTLTVGGALQLTVEVWSHQTERLYGRSIVYRSSNPAVAQVGETGLVTALAVGTSTISAAVEGTSATTIVAVEAAKNPWLTSKLYGHDNDAAALRKVTISEENEKYRVLIENQFGFTCDLSFDDEGNPVLLTNCTASGWRILETEVPLKCRSKARERVCSGKNTLCPEDYDDASCVSFVGGGEMVIARRLRDGR